MLKLAMNQNTYNKLPNKDENTFYFIDNTLKDGEIKNCANYLLSDEVAAVRKKILESEEIRDRSYKIEKCCFNCRHRLWSVDDTSWCMVTVDYKEVDQCGTCDLWEGE